MRGVLTRDEEARLIEGIRSRVPLSPRAEITLEANPGTVEHGAFADYRAAGINRVSLGVQSFDDGLLERIGRIHSGAEAERAVASLHACGLENFNLDLMFGLPGQSGAQACDDIRRALDCRPAHLSHYRLTLEPTTAFHAKPPVLPDDDLAWSMQAACAQLLASAGFFQYEVSAWARPRRECRHNLNYWRYGDYLGIGAGAHGKVSLMAEQSIRRRIRHRHPEHWMQRAHAGGGLAVEQAVAAEDRVFEFFLNQLRLRAGASKTQFSARTLLPWDRAAAPVQRAIDQGLLEEDGDRLLHTELGWRFSNETQALFLP